MNTELEGGSDVIPIIEDFDDIRVAWETHNMSEDLTTAEEASAVKKRLKMSNTCTVLYV